MRESAGRGVRGAGSALRLAPPPAFGFFHGRGNRPDTTAPAACEAAGLQRVASGCREFQQLDRA